MFYMNVEECWVLRRATLLVRAYDAAKRYHVIQHVTYFKNIPLLPSIYFAADREGSKFLLECKVLWAHWYVG